MVKLSVCITTYNHENYIEHALEGVLNQVTDFNYEILIGEDDSADRTREICKHYADKYPDKIRLFLNDRKNVIYIDGNPTGRWNFLNLLKHARGEYIARCDGDDYWTSVNKLQKMVDYLDANPEYSVAFHPVQWHKNGTLQDEPAPPPAGKDSFTADDLFLNDSFIRTSSVIYRNHLKGKMPEWFREVAYGDICMHLIHCQYGKIGFFPEVMGVYRVHDKGIYSSQKPIVNWMKSIKTYTIAAENLGFMDKPSYKHGIARLYTAISEEAKKTALKLKREAEQINDTSKQNESLVSVILPTHNRPDRLKEALKSVADQTYNTIEVIVVNDAGEDVSHIIDPYRPHLDIKYIEHKENKYLAAARNTGIKNASGQYLAYLDDDDIYYPTHIETAVKILKNTEYSVVYSDGVRAHQLKQGNTFNLMFRDVPYSADFDKKRLMIGNYIPVLNLVHARSCIDKTGFFDEQLRTHEDWDFFIRLAHHYDFYHIKRVTAEFRWRYDGSDMTSGNRDDFVKSTEYIYEKYKKEVKQDQQLVEWQNHHLRALKEQIANENNVKEKGRHRFDFQGALVSIIIPLFNQVAYTKKCIKALFTNTRYQPFQLILVDNASSDDTGEFLDELVKTFPMIHIIRNPENYGFAKACNQGAEAAKGEYLLFLNNDTEVQPDWLFHLVITAHNDRRVAAVGSKLLYPDNTIQHAGVLVSRDEKIGNPLAPWHIHMNAEADFEGANIPFEYQALTAACLLVKKDDFEQVEGFNEIYKNGYEDVDLCFKLGQHDKKLVYQPSSVVIHHESKSGKERFAYMDNNQRILHDRWVGTILPDNIVLADGSVVATHGNKAKPYVEQLDIPGAVTTTANQTLDKDSQNSNGKRPKISFLALDSHSYACPQLRLKGPLQMLDRLEKIDYLPLEIVGENPEQISGDRLKNLDLLIIQRNFAAVVPYEQLTTLFKGDMPKIIYEFDDAFDKLTESHPAFAYYQKMKPRFEEYIRKADAVTVSTVQLKRYYSALNSNIHVLPNTLNPEIWKSEPIEDTSGSEKVRILFAGTNGHLADLKMIEPAVEKILKHYGHKVEFCFWASMETALDQLPNFKKLSEFNPDYQKYAETLLTSGIDLVLVPLVREPANNAKSHIKWLEYSVCRIAGIYSDSPAYNRVIEDGKTGVLVKNTTKAWYQAMRDLIEHPEKRKTIADSAHKAVVSKHLLDQHIEKWWKVYDNTLNKNAGSEKQSALRQRVSIIIPLYNQKELTEKCLEALYANTPAHLFELILIDNASGDGTAELMNSWKKKHDNIKTICNKRNLGFAKANNQGAKKARGDFLLFLNNDTEVGENWLQPLMDTLDKDGSVGAAGSKLLYPDGTIQHAGVVLIDNSVGGDPLLAMHHFHKQPGNYPEANFAKTYQALTAACLMVRKEAFQKAGQFDTRYYNGYEDVDLCLNLAKLGYKLVYEPGSVVIHHESQSGEERWKKVQHNIERLHQKWLGKVTPDLVVEEGDRPVWKEESPVKPYPAIESEVQQVHTSDEDSSDPKIPEDGSPMVSIILLTWNALKFTRETIDSILKHTDVPYEVIVIDNASTDGTQEYLKKLTRREKHIRAFYNKSNIGFAAGNNMGVKEARGEYVMLLNNDVHVGKGWLSGLLEAIQLDPRIGMVGPLTNSISGRQLIAEVPYTNLDGFYDFSKEVQRINQGKITPRRRLAGFALLLPKNVYQLVDGLDESYGSGNFEDDDLSLKLRKEGYALMVNEAIFIHHYGSQTFIANKIDYQQSLDQRGKLFRQNWPDVDYEELLELNGSLVDALDKKRDLAQAHFEQGQMQEACKVFEEILMYNPIDGGALLGTALSLKNLDDKPACLEVLEKFIRLYPGNPVGYNELGVLSMELDDAAGAKQLFIKSIEVDPSFVDAQRNYADALIAEEDYDNGVIALVKILDNHPHDIPTLLYLANLYIEVGRLENALGFLQKVLEIEPGNDTASRMLDLVAELNETNRKQMETEESATPSGEITPLLENANDLLASDKPLEASEAYGAVLEKYPEDPSALFGLGLSKFVLEDLPAAKNAFDRLLMIEPDFAEAHYNLGVIHMQNGETEKAIAEFTSTLELDNDHKNAQIYLSDMLIQQELYDEGLQLLQNVLVKNPDNIFALTRMGNICLEVDRKQDARIYFSKILEIDPENEWAVSGLNQMNVGKQT